MVKCIIPTPNYHDPSTILRDAYISCHVDTKITCHMNISDPNFLFFPPLHFILFSLFFPRQKKGRTEKMEKKINKMSQHPCSMSRERRVGSQRDHENLEP